MSEIQPQKPMNVDLGRFSIADLLLATFLAAGPMAFYSLIGWKAVVCLMLMAIALTVGRVCKRHIFQVLLAVLAIASGAAIAASAVSMVGLLASLGWMLVVVLSAVLWEAGYHFR